MNWRPSGPPGLVLLVAILFVQGLSTGSGRGTDTPSGPALTGPGLTRLTSVNPISPTCGDAPYLKLAHHAIRVDDAAGLLDLEIALGPSVRFEDEVVNWPLRFAGRVEALGSSWDLYQENYRGSVAKISYRPSALLISLPITLMGEEEELLGLLEVACELSGLVLSCESAEFKSRRSVVRRLP